MLVSDPVSYLRGEWQYRRSILDRFNQQDGSATGKAVFAVSGDGISWHESGQLRLGDSLTSASRDLRVVRDPSSPTGWMVTFEDGRPFHPFRLGTDSCELEHPCRDDMYLGEMRIVDADSFETRWRVLGPAKDHIIETVYRRAETMNHP